MKTDSIYEDFKQLIEQDKPVCTKEDLDKLLLYGLIIETPNGYYTRSNNKVELTLVKPKSMNIDFTGIISNGISLSKKLHCNRVYYMSKGCYEKYKQLGYIIKIDEQDYYRLYNKEPWIVVIL